MEYRTMNRKELAAELYISYVTLYRRMETIDQEFLKHIKGRSLLFENEVRYIYENIERRRQWKIDIGS